jgi:hypothetical protein
VKYLQLSFNVGGHSKEFEEGFDRIFGERQVTRGRFVYRKDDAGNVVAVQVDGEWDDAPRSTGDLGKFEYSNLRATDGADISSPTKRREYMRAMGVTDASDFKETWAKAQYEREAFRKGEHHSPERREAIGRIAYELEKRRNKR